MEPKAFVLEVMVIQVIAVLGLLIAIVILWRQTKALKYERRISKFALDPNSEDEISLFDKLFAKGWMILRKTSSVIKKSAVLNRYGEKYDRFITFEEKDFKNGIDYISLKIILVIIIEFLYLFTMMFQYIHFNIYTAIIAACLAFFVPDIYLNYQFNKKRKLVEDDLLKAVIIMNNAFKSGSNVTQAVEIVKQELEGPIQDEFKKIYIDINYGLSLEVVFKRFYERVKLEDAQYITSSLSLLNKTGGNIVKVFSMIEKSFFDKKKLRNELNSLTASSVFVFRMLIFLPFLFTLVIFILNPTYFNPLFEHKIGMLILGIIILLYSLYIIVIKRLLKVKL